MGFRCEVCGESVQAGTPAHKIIVAKRVRHYSHRREVQRKIVLDEKGRKKEKWLDDQGGVGWEIAKEVTACPHCVQKFEAANKKAAALKAG